MKKRKVRFQPYLTDELHQRIERYCAQRGVHLSAFAQATFVQRLDGTSDMSLLYRRLDSVNRRGERLGPRTPCPLEGPGRSRAKVQYEAKAPPETTSNWRAFGTEGPA